MKKNVLALSIAAMVGGLGFAGGLPRLAGGAACLGAAGGLDGLAGLGGWGFRRRVGRSPASGSW